MLCMRRELIEQVRVLQVFDLRMDSSQYPLSTMLDPGFVTGCPNQPDCLKTASQNGAFQTLRLGEHNREPESLGNLLSFDRLVSFKISPK